MIAERSSAYLAYNSSVMKLTYPLSASLRRGGAMCSRSHFAITGGITVRETLYNCNEGEATILAVGAKYT